MSLKQTVKVVNQGSCIMTIPKAMCQILNIEPGTILSVELDIENNQMIVKKDN